MLWNGSLREVANTCDYKSIMDIIKTISKSEWKKDAEKRNSKMVHGTTTALFLKYKSQSYEKNDNITMNKLKPYLDEIISQIKNFYGYTSILLTRVIITELSKGSIIPEHTDEGELLNTNHRVHIPLVSDPTVKFSLDHKDYYLKPGYAYEINNQLIHAVRNESNIDRIHMIIDLKEWKNNDKEIKAYEVDLKNY